MRNDRTRRLRACGAAGKRQQRDVAGALDGHAEPTLVTRADAGHAARQNLAALLHELRKNVGALVVDEIHLLDAELADFLLAEILALAAAGPPGPPRTARTSAAGTAFADRGSTVPACRAAVAAFAFAAGRVRWEPGACFCSSAIPSYPFSSTIEPSSNIEPKFVKNGTLELRTPTETSLARGCCSARGCWRRSRSGSAARCGADAARRAFRACQPSFF